MITAPTVIDEPGRLAALHGYGILDTLPEEVYDDVTRLAAQICGTPTALISLVDANRQWFKSRVGMDVCGLPRDISFCGHVIAEPDLFIIPDAAADERFADNPLVTGDLHIQFYAGMPLTTDEGHAIGSLCVIDRVPRHLTEDQYNGLRSLGRVVMALLKLRLSERTRDEADARREEAENERRQAEAEAKDQAIRHQAILNASLDCIITIDVQGRIVEWNPTAERTFGWTAEEMLGQSLTETIIPHAFRGSHTHGISHYLATGDGPVLNKRVELSALRRDGTEFTAELTVVPMQVGGQTYFTANLRDITERQRAEQAVRESEEQHRLLFDAHPHALCIHDPETAEIFAVNAAATQQYGYSRDALLRMTLFDLYLPEDHPRLRRIFQDTPADAYHYGESQHVRSDGLLMWVAIHARPILFGSRKARIMSAEDITERREADLALQRMFVQSEHLLAAIPSVLIAVDGSGVITAWNAAAERVFGVSRADTVGLIFTQCALAWDWERIIPALDDCCAGGKTTRLEDVEYRHPDGSLRLLGLNLNPLPRGQDQNEGFLLLAADVTERRQSQEALLRSMSLLKAQQEATIDGILVVDENKRITSFNRNFARLWNVPEALVNAGDDGPILQAAVTATLDPEGFLERVDYLYANPDIAVSDEVPLKDGRIFERYSGPVVSLDGDYYGRIWSFRDITERRRAEAELASSARLIADQSAEREQLSRQIDRLSLISAKTTNAVIVTDCEGRVEWVNDSFTRITGYTLSEAMGNTPGQILQGPGTDAETIAALSHAVRERQSFDGEIYNYRKDGRGYWQTLSVCPIFNETDHTLQGFIGIQTDLWTDRKRTEEETDRLASIVESSHDAIISKNLDDTITSWNSGAEELYGYTAEEIVGQSIAILVPPDRKDELALISAQYRRGERMESYESVRINKSGCPVDVSITVSPIKDAEGRVIGASNISRNITAQKRAERDMAEARRALEDSNWELADARDAALAAARLKSEFLANMSHEIRTPMNGVLGMLGLLLDTPLEEEQQFFARTVKQSADSLMTIINDILDFSKIEAGKMTIEHIDFSVRETLEDVADLLAGRAHEKGLEFVCDLPPLGPSKASEALLGDAGRLRQVITNLLGNAVKFTDRGEVVLEARLVWDTDAQVRWRIAVRDTGIGIPSDRQTMIFDSFTQADGSTTRRFGGTGLGLTICRQLTALMGGEMGVESTPGQGSTFWVELTLDKQCAGQAAPAGAQVTDALAGMHVFLAGGVGSSFAAIERWLEAWGCTVLTDQDRLNVPLDAIVLDTDAELDLPAILQRLSRAAPPTMPIVRLSKTANAEPPCVRKPVRQAALIDALRQTSKQQAQSPAPHVHSAGLLSASIPSRKCGKILLAEDNPVNQMVANRLLLRLGFDAGDVTTVATGRQALDALDESSFALVLMDVQMPEMDGLDAVAAIRSRKRDRRLPVIAMTAHAMAGDRERCLDAGMSDYLSKPISVEKLTEVIDRWMPQLTRDETSTMTPTTTGPMRAIHVAALAEISGGDAEIEADLAREFARSAPGMLAHCRHMLETRDAHGLEHWAHTLKGSGQIFGATALVASCQTLENLGRNNSLDAAAPILEALESEWAHVSKELTGLWKRERVE